MSDGRTEVETSGSAQGVEPPARDASVPTPDGWTQETRRIGTATPDGEVWKEVAYYRHPCGMEFVAVPAGGFIMGAPRDEPGMRRSESPQHEVRITRTFLLGACEVTQEQYAAVTGQNPSRFTAPRGPVDSVSWDDAAAFCARLSEMDGATYRLPTEAEWEYACRAGSTTVYCFGDDPEPLVDYAWYSRNSGSRPHEVGSKLPNAWGLYDMHGNVWEWCQDWYVDGYRSRAPVDPTGPASSTYRAVRGGSWFDYPTPLRSAGRGKDQPFNHVDDHGFRVVCELRP